MTYRINGRIVTREEFLAGANGVQDILARGKAPQCSSFQPFISPIDGKEITSRKQLEAHNRHYDVVQVGDEFEKKRDKYLEKEEFEAAPDVDVVEDVQRIIEGG